MKQPDAPVAPPQRPGDDRTNGSPPAEPAGAQPVERERDLARLARGGVLSLVGALTYGVLNFVLMVVLTRGLGASQAGGFISAMALFAVFTQSAVLGADTGLIRAVPRLRVEARRDDLRPFLLLSLGPVALLATAFAVTWYLAAGGVAELFGGENERNIDEVATYGRYLAPLLPISALYWTLASATRGFGTMIPSVVIDKIAKPAAQPLLVLIVILTGAGPVALSLAWSTPTIAALVVAAVWVRHLVLKWERGAVQRVGRILTMRELAVEFWSFTLPRALASWFRVALQWLDVLLVGAFMEPRDVAVYAAATRLLQLGNYLALSVAQVAQPMFAEFFSRGEVYRATHVYQTATAWLTGLSWPPYLMLAIFAPAVLPLFGTDFEEGAAVVSILAVFRLVSTGVGPVDMVLLMGGRSSWSLINAGVALVANVVFNMLLIPRYGLIGAAVAWLLAGLVNNLVPLYQVWRYIGVHPFGAALARATLLSVGCVALPALAVRAVLGPSTLALVLGVVVLGPLYLFAAFRSRERLELAALAQGFKRRKRTRLVGAQSVAG